MPSEVWFRDDQPTVAWRSPDADRPIDALEIVQPVQQVAGGTVIEFVPETRWVRCRDAVDPSVQPMWWRYYLKQDERRDERGVLWVRLGAR